MEREERGDRGVNFFAEYSYLGFSLVLSLLAGWLLLRAGRHRAFFLLGGIWAIPFAFFSYLFIPTYWNPKVLGHFMTSVEDVLFMWATGVLAVSATFLPVAKRMTPPRLTLRGSARKALVLAVGGLVCWSVFSAAGWAWVRPAESTACVITIFGGTYAVLRRDILGLAFRGAVIFVVFYASYVLFCRWLTPGAFAVCWNPKAYVWGAVLGAPVFEVGWAGLFGLCWPLVMAHVLEVRVLPREAERAAIF